MINITASGRLAHQPELKMGRQTNVCEFRLLSSRYARGEEHTEAVTFFCYGEEAERFCELTEKGQLIEATGTQETQRWTDASGTEKTAVKYKLTWWQAGPRSNRNRPAGDSREQSQAPRGSYQGQRPAAAARPPARDGQQDDGRERERVPLI
jgi:single-stranded DNA-binding protein